jgi:outer membrane receptor for ferrienterochelin and colicins
VLGQARASSNPTLFALVYRSVVRLRGSKQMFIHFSPSLACAFALLASAGARAAEPSASEPSSAHTEIVITGTRTKESLQRATVRTELVTRAEADRRGARNVADALAGESTLTVQPGTSGLSGSVMINGMDGERVLILEDGEPIAGRSSGAVDLGEIPLTGIERIEYVAGPMSALYGSDAIGGVINLITGPPVRPGLSLHTRAELWSRGEAFDELAAYYRGESSWAALGSSLSARSASQRGDGPSLQIPSSRTGGVALRAGARVLPRIELKLKSRWAREQRESIFTTTELLGGDPVQRSEAPTLTSDRYALRALANVSLGARSQLDFSLGKSWYAADTRTRKPGQPADSLQEERESTQSFEGVLTHGEGARTWVLGVGSRSEKLTSTARTWDANVNPPLLEEGDALPPTLRSSAAGFVQLGWELTPELTILPGFRFELQNQHGAVPAPRLAVAYRPSQAFALRAAAGRGFRSPSPKELGYQLDHCWLGYSVAGNAELDPEKSWGFTSDATLRDGERLAIRLGAFGNWVEDMIGLTHAADGLCAGGINFQAVNLARARTAGSDLSLRAEPWSWLRTGVSYAYLWTRDDQTGQQITDRPPHTVVAWVTAEGLPLGLSVNLRFKHTSAAFIENGDLDLESPGFDSFDARVAVRPLAQLELYVGAKNLLNISQGEGEEVIADQGVVPSQRPVEGTSFYLGLSGQFGRDAGEAP